MRVLLRAQWHSKYRENFAQTYDGVCDEEDCVENAQERLGVLGVVEQVATAPSLKRNILQSSDRANF